MHAKVIISSLYATLVSRRFQRTLCFRTAKATCIHRYTSHRHGKFCDISFTPKEAPYPLAVIPQLRLPTPHPLRETTNLLPVSTD